MMLIQCMLGRYHNLQSAQSSLHQLTASKSLRSSLDIIITAHEVNLAIVLTRANKSACHTYLTEDKGDVVSVREAVDIEECYSHISSLQRSKVHPVVTISNQWQILSLGHLLQHGGLHKAALYAQRVLIDSDHFPIRKGKVNAVITIRTGDPEVKGNMISDIKFTAFHSE